MDYGVLIMSVKLQERKFMDDDKHVNEMNEIFIKVPLTVSMLSKAFN